MKKNLRKILNKSLCITLSIAMAGCLTACGTSELRAEEKMAEAPADEERVLDSAINQISGRNSTDYGKEETVYVLSDATGAPNKVIVSDWIKNPEASKELSDASDLVDIENMKGYETFTKEKDGTIVWDANGSDIYYEGTSQKEVPVDVTITYTLDGKEISPDELAGKSGNVKIRFNYSNKAKVKAEVGDHEEELPVPFTMVSGLVLPTENFKNVSINNGKIISEGSNAIVVGVAFPGLQDGLDLDEVKDSLDDEEQKEKVDTIDIPDYVEVSADCVDFSLEMTMTVAMSDILSSVNLTDQIDLTDINESMDDLEDATKKLKDGTGDMKDATEELLDGSGDLVEAGVDLKDGTVKLKDGATELHDKCGELDNGVKTLNNSMGDLADGTAKIKDGSSQMNTGMGTLDTGLNKLNNTMTSALGTVIGAFSGANGLVAGAKSLSDNCAELSSMMNNYVTLEASQDAQLQGILKSLAQQINAASMSQQQASSELAKVEALRDSAKENLDAVCQDAGIDAPDAGQTPVVTNYDGTSKVSEENASAIADAVNEYTQVQEKVTELQIEEAVQGATAETLEAKRQQIVALLEYKTSVTDAQTGGTYTKASYLAVMKATCSSLAEGSAKLSGGLNQLYAGIQSLISGLNNTSTGLPALLSGSAKLKSATKTAMDGTNKLDDGADKLFEGTNKLKENTTKLVNATGELKDGTVELDDAAVDFQDAFSDLDDGAHEMDDGAKDLKEGMEDYDKDGIQKITNLFGDDVQNVTDRLNAIKDAGSDYQTFTKLPEGVDGSVKFIIKTEAIK
ncbi:MAG: hypothetical protein PHY47_22130 [Lachnospiraceae bacterium]|nr:hypothetical protein [Lachnospiraceae bacterium]